MSAVPRSSVSKLVPVAPVSSFEVSAQSLPIWLTSKGDPTASLRTRFDTSANTSPTVHAGDTLGMRCPWPVIKLTPKPLKGKLEQNTLHVSLNKPAIQSARRDSNGRAAVRARQTAISSSAEPNTRDMRAWANQSCQCGACSRINLHSIAPIQWRMLCATS